MTTEITDNTVGRDVILFDGACGVCRVTAGWMHRILTQRGFVLMPLQAEEASTLAGATTEQMLREVHLVTPARTVLRGVDAVLYIARTIAWARPFTWLASIPGVKPILRRAYQAFADRRYRISEVCRIGTEKSFDPMRWLPLAVLLIGALLSGGWVAPHILMAMIAAAMYAGFKGAMWWPNRRSAPVWRSVAFLLAYPGMNAREFLTRDASHRPSARQWLWAIAKTAIGMAIVFGIARRFVDPVGLTAGWIGAIGIVLMLHFGLLEILALFWQRMGVRAEPLMNAPCRAMSVGDFWGRRWNTAFRAISHDMLFAPVVKHVGPIGATFGVFLFSGIIHDLAISVPAGAGYGLPTLYFLIQFAGLMLERTRFMRPILRKGLVGWIYMLIVVLAPLPIMAHREFVTRVLVGQLQFMGAI